MLPKLFPMFNKSLLQAGARFMFYKNGEGQRNLKLHFKIE
jgi:hypothetical protein